MKTVDFSKDSNSRAMSTIDKIPSLEKIPLGVGFMVIEDDQIIHVNHGNTHLTFTMRSDVLLNLECW
jgi:hypothetical protein